MNFLIPIFLVVHTNALLVHKSGISQYNFYEMNLCIDVCLKHSETVIYKVSQNLIQSNPLREFDYRDLMESKKYLIENCEDPNTFYLGWESANQTDYEFAEKRTVLPQCFLFIKKHPSKKTNHLEMIVSNPLALSYDHDTQKLKSTLEALARAKKEKFAYDKLEFIQNKKWFLDFNFETEFDV